MLMKSYLSVQNMGTEWRMSKTGYYQNFLLAQLTTLRFVLIYFGSRILLM